MVMKKAVFLYDKTGIMAQPWLDAGYECWLFDGQHDSGINKEGRLVKVGMWFLPNEIEKHAKEIKTLVGDAVFVFGFPECTDLAVSGAAHFAKKRTENPEFQNEATSLARLVELVGVNLGALGALKILSVYCQHYGESLISIFILGSLVAIYLMMMLTRYTLNT